VDGTARRIETLVTRLLMQADPSEAALKSYSPKRIQSAYCTLVSIHLNETCVRRAQLAVCVLKPIMAEYGPQQMGSLGLHSSRNPTQARRLAKRDYLLEESVKDTNTKV
jgi:hypothetical protein